MNMVTLFFLTLNGLTFAALLFVMASGLTLAFGLMRVINLSHGALYMLGGYLGVHLYGLTGSFALALAAGAGSALLLGVFVERVLLHRIRGQELPEAIVTIGVAIIVADAMLVVFGGLPQRLSAPPFLSGAVDLGLLSYPLFRLSVLGVAVLLGFTLWLVLTRTRVGAAIRCGVDDRETAESQGINVALLFSIVFGFASALAGLAGVLGASFISLSATTGVRVLMLSLVVVILGGLGSITGAMVGAIITGLVVSFASAYAPQFALMFLFVPLVLVLTFRPHGLFGRA
jgi:branched-chain amino acid transport system permease protein